MDNILINIFSYLPAIITLLVTILVLQAVIIYFRKRPDLSTKFAFGRGIISIIIILIGLILFIVVLPISETLRDSLLTVVGIVISATITLSSTTFVGNAMAGFMLRTMQKFRVGDFISIEDHFGRISEHSLLYTEIQTLKSDLTTLPNLYLVTHPMTIIRATGTIITAEISLGYDISREKIEKVLIEAATDAGLQDPFVRVLDLGDFSVEYSCCGFLEEAKHLISSQTKLKSKILDHMHKNNIEIVSPGFINLRDLPDNKIFMPKEKRKKTEKDEEQETLEDKMFDKAESAAQLENMKKQVEKIQNDVAELEKKLKEQKDEMGCASIQEQIKTLEEQKIELEISIKEIEKPEEDELENEDVKENE